MTASRIRELNDRFRRTFIGGRVTLTRGVADDHEVAVQLLAAVRTFDAFTDDNDPHGEHDFGAIDHAGIRYFWKIDYYDLQLAGASPDPADPAVTVRVLTVMRADEY